MCGTYVVGAPGVCPGGGNYFPPLVILPESFSMEREVRGSPGVADDAPSVRVLTIATPEDPLINREYS